MAVAVIDYNAGNLKSVETALKYLNTDYYVSNDPDTIKTASRVIFPGVGEAKAAMDTLNKSGIGDAIKKVFEKGIPLMGICLGSQIILEHSEESDTRCLGLIKGTAKRFESVPGYKVPHMGWNQVSSNKETVFFNKIPGDASFYFVHSYYPNPVEEAVCGNTDYIVKFASALSYRNLFAVQFHPEKSGKFGLQMLKNFLDWNYDA